MVSKCVITPIYPIYKQVIAHLLTTDPNFMGHPSTTFPNKALFLGGYVRGGRLTSHDSFISFYRP